MGRRGVLWGMHRMDPEHFYSNPWFAADILVREEPDEDEDEEEEDDDDNQQDDDGDEGYSE
jgi:hypothetical protein